jgi:hypothetical protein
MKVTEEMVDRFLMWPLPRDFSPDCGIGFDGRKDAGWHQSKTWPIGTNLLTAKQARAMLENVLNPGEACVITVYGMPVDVAALYRERGFQVLPPTLTMSGWDMHIYGNVPSNYSIVRADSMGGPYIRDDEAWTVKDGDQFIAVPPATM